MDNELNLRLLGMMHQISHLMQTQEKFRGQGRLLVLLNQYGALTQPGIDRADRTPLRNAQRTVGWHGKGRSDPPLQKRTGQAKCGC